MGARPFLAPLLLTVTLAATSAATAQQSFFEQGRDYFLTKTIEGAQLWSLEDVFTQKKK